MRNAPRFEAVPLRLVDNPVAVDYVRKVLGLVLVGLLVAALGARVGMSQAILPIVAGSPWIGLFAMLGLVFWASRAANGPNAVPVYYLFTFAMGLLMAPVFYFTLAKVGGAGTLGTAGLLTAVNVGALALYATVSKRDFSFLGGFLFVGLLSMIGLGLVNAFWLHSSPLGTMMSGVLVLLFNGFILYDLSRLLNSGASIPPTAAALALFLDVFNLFLAYLRLLDRR